MGKGDTLPLPRFAFFLLWLPSVYRTASMGETFAASRPGLAQDSSTVNRANRAEPTKIRGCTDTVLTTPVQPLDHHGRQQTAHHPAQHKPDGDADTAQKQRLLPQQSF